MLYHSPDDGVTWLPILPGIPGPPGPKGDKGDPGDSGGGGGVTDHGALTGLSDDDHTQYHTDARGDARYSQIAHTHTQAQSHNSADTDSAPTALHHTLGTGANQAAAGNDSRFTNSRPPSGSASGDLSGVYPNPQIAAGVIEDSDINISAGIQQVKVANLTEDLSARVLKAGDTMTGPLQIIEGAFLKGISTWWGDRDAFRITDSGGTNLRWLEVASPQTNSEAANKGYVDSLLAHRNRVINGDFSVNQRQATTTSINFGFIHDRWHLTFVGGTCSYSAVTPALGELPESATSYARLSVSGQSTGSDYAYLVQKIEGVRTLSNKTVTVSFWAKASAAGLKTAVILQQYFAGSSGGSASVNVGAGVVTLTTAWARYSVTTTLPSINGMTIGTLKDDYLRPTLCVSSYPGNPAAGGIGIQTGTFDFWGVQVEEGPNATLYEYRTYSDTLLACQRYYWRFLSPSNDFPFLSGQATTPSNAYFPMRFPVQMRIPPAFGGAGTWQCITAGWGLGTAASSVVMANPATYTSKDHCMIQVGGVSGLVAGNATTLYAATAGGYLSFDAEL